VENDTPSSVIGIAQPVIPPGLDESPDEIGRTYMTVSQTANEKAHLPTPRPDKTNGLV
jgi:hypothetical protein